jgi:hypothetical protein
MFKLSVASILLAAAIAVPSAIASPTLPPSEQVTSAVEKAQWDMRRCRAWRHECAERQGWGTERFHRCLARHGCERHRYGDRWDR